MGSVVLTLFSASMLLFQMSCKKEANAQTTTTGLKQLNLIVFSKSIYVTTPTGTTSTNEIWTANIDGTNQKKIPITLPSGVKILANSKLSPDGKVIIFDVADAANEINLIYSCSIDGSNLKKIIDVTTPNNLANIQGVY